MRSTMVAVGAVLALAACGGAEEQELSGAEGNWAFQVESSRMWQGTLRIEPPNDKGDIVASIHIEDMVEPAARSYEGIAGGIYSGDLLILRANVSSFRPWNIIAKVEADGQELRGYAMGSGFEAAPFIAKRRP